MKLLKRIKWENVLILVLAAAWIGAVLFQARSVAIEKERVRQIEAEIQSLKDERDALERTINNQESQLFELRWKLSTAEDEITELKGK